MTSDSNNSLGINGLIGLADNYGHYFGDEETFSGAEDWLYICDTETYEMLLLQCNSENTPVSRLGDWHGKKCYEFLSGRTSPCEFCPMENVRRDNYYVWTHKNERLGEDVFSKDIIIDWNGRPAKLQTVIDIECQKRREQVMDEYILSRNVLTNILGCLMDESPIKDNFSKICRILGEFFGADRALITEYCTGRLNTCWSKIDVPFTQICTELSGDAAKKLTDATIHLRYIWIPDIENADKLDIKIRQYWKAQGINSIMLIPMHYNGDFIGTVSLHNIRKHFSGTDTLSLVGMSVAKCIHSYVVEKNAEKKLYTDPLTGISNFSGLKLKAYELLKKNPETQYFFCVLDIRYFSSINRRYSFELGDTILKKAAQLLDKCIAPDEACCRIAADQFCFFAKYPGEENVRKRFDKFVEMMQCVDELNVSNYKLEFQGGVYVCSENISISQAIDKANVARRSLKNYHSSNIAFFNNELLEQSKREVELIQDFKNALIGDEITVYFQPQCKYTSNKIVGAEALVRWISPKHGYVSPAEFIPLLERHGLIFELDRYVWELVCKYQRKWIDMGFRCPVSVNVSRHDVLRNGICEELCGLLDKYGIPKELLPLEITETAYIKNSGELIEVVNMLKNSGFTVEMDDFGSGYSSLNALKDVAVDLLKLDMKFLDMGDHTGKGGSILNCIVRMTRWLNLSVLAEGVETKAQAEYLKNIGCDLMQGYYFAKPMPAEEFEALISAECSESEKSEPNTELISVEKFIESIVSNPILFNHIGAAAIVEYYNGNLEALMLNDDFFEMIDCTREEFMPYMKQMNKYTEVMQNQPHAADIFRQMVNGTRTNDFVMSRKNGSTRKVRVYCRRLLSDGERHILLLTLDDISDIAVNLQRIASDR